MYCKALLGRNTRSGIKDVDKRQKHNSFVDILLKGNAAEQKTGRQDGHVFI